MHQRGYLLPFRHFHNLSHTRDGVLMMHDLGDRCALSLRHMWSENQFVAEAFTNLAFAMAPMEHIVDSAPRYLEVREVVTENAEEFGEATLEGYLGGPSHGTEFSFASVERAFRAGFHAPFHQTGDPVARAYRALFADLAADARHDSWAVSEAEGR